MFKRLWQVLPGLVSGKPISEHGQLSQHAKVDFDPVDALAEALLDVIDAWPEWCYRRVDSVHPLEGQRGRIRHSIDCAPPPDPRLAYEPLERVVQQIDSVQGLIAVPLALIAKVPMRHLDATDRNGNSMPIVGAGETVTFASAMMLHALASDGIEPSNDIHEVLEYIAGPAGPFEADEIGALLESGEWKGSSVWGADTPLSEKTKQLIRDFGESFLLTGLIPSKDAGIRQVLKFSYHWVVTPPSWGSRLASVFVGAGLASRSITILMHAPYAARSYHLEFQTPPELRCVSLSLPSAGSRSIDASATDVSGLPTAHAHSRYVIPPVPEARLELAVPASGLWTSTVVATGLTTVIFLLAIVLPGAQHELLIASGSAAALLLAAPVVFLGFLAIRSESALSAGMLVPLRITLVASSLSLLAMSASLVGQLIQPWLDLLWGAGLALNLGFFAMLLMSRLARWGMSVLWPYNTDNTLWWDEWKRSKP